MWVSCVCCSDPGRGGGVAHCGCRVDRAALRLLLCVCCQESSPRYVSLSISVSTHLLCSGLVVPHTAYITSPCITGLTWLLLVQLR